MESARTIDRPRLQGALTVDEAATRLRAINDWLEAIDLVLLRPPVLNRASEPLPTPLATLDAIHLAAALIWREHMGYCRRSRRMTPRWASPREPLDLTFEESDGDGGRLALCDWLQFLGRETFLRNKRAAGLCDRTRNRSKGSSWPEAVRLLKTGLARDLFRKRGVAVHSYLLGRPGRSNRGRGDQSGNETPATDDCREVPNSAGLE